ncbi:MAG TPA: hypothetical protein PKB04_05505, partial [Phenylobacterium sp.]|nr:hypothetical protein [Phenylobacterium sp.]
DKLSDLHGVLTPAAAMGGPSWAQVVTQDRYGPPPAAAYGPGRATGPQPSTGFLAWPGKNPPPAQGEASLAAQRPEPLALARQFAPGPGAARPPASPAPVTAPAPQAPALPMFAPASEPVQRGRVLAAAASPDGLLGGPPAASIYDAPRPTPATSAVPSAAPTAVAQRAPGSGGQLYSLHRAYGLEPDSIPAPPAGTHYVLVGPAETPADRDADEAGDGFADFP